MLKTIAILAVLWFLAAVASAQDRRFDFSANEGALFTNQVSGNGIVQTATDGAGPFGTIRVRFNPKHSFVFNYGRYKNSQIYHSIEDFHVLANITEYSGAYMFTPFKKGRLEPFLLAGVGALRFSPRTTWVFLPPLEPPEGNNTPDNIQINLHAAKQTQIAFLYGLGVDYQVPKFHRFALRFQYRGFLYKAPDFRIDASSGSVLSLFTGARSHMAEPSAGLVFRF
jgi:opacity protein-like surface antigen